ncbi:extracellular solute-binding protein [Devosia algicola]|uniref:Extracellular solute-binding protein n=1 Tax=Devosia algicola TaxID=3026418 RepID=A0ABY7YSZ3_9HYPH|nr:extracellular solute-binding protein [Devosia algicola]WDR04369.1 extracellular solute-binding protein [Devosia algicola]
MEAVSKYFYYDKQFFADNNLSVPTSFNGVLDLCKAIRKINPSIVPLPIGNSERWHVVHYMTVLNERVLGIDGTKADYDLSASDADLFTDPGYVEAWNKLLELQDAGCFQDAPNATSPEVAWSMFSSQISPMIYCGTWCMSTFNKDGFTDYALFRFPPVEGGKSDGTTNMVVPQGMQVSSKTQHPEEAVAWLSLPCDA